MASGPVNHRSGMGQLDDLSDSRNSLRWGLARDENNAGFLDLWKLQRKVVVLCCFLGSRNRRTFFWSRAIETNPCWRDDCRAAYLNPERTGVIAMAATAELTPPRIPPPTDEKRTIGRVVGRDSYGTNRDVWNLLARTGVIPTNPTCDACHRPLNTERAKDALHFSLMCWSCRKATSVVRNTLLFNIRAHRKFLYALEGWCRGDKACSIQASGGITKAMWRRYKHVFNTVVSKSLEGANWSSDGMIGGPGVVVEVDECHLHERKYHRGAALVTSAVWVVGVIERGDGGRRAAFLLTERRGGDVLVPFIKQHVARGSILISDEWKGYTGDLADDYTVLNVNHSNEFGRYVVLDGAILPVNTNHIEREWREVRKVVEYRGLDCYAEQLNREIFRLLFFRDRPIEERPFIFLEKIGLLNDN